MEMVLNRHFTMTHQFSTCLFIDGKRDRFIPLDLKVDQTGAERALVLDSKFNRRLLSLKTDHNSNVNIPWPCGGMGDGDYLYAFNHVVMPIAQEFNPDFVIVSAGFDAAAGDRIGECLVTPNGYAHMIYQLKSLANGRIAVILEGGYNLKSIANSAVAVGKILMGGVPERIRDLVASPAAAETVDRVIKAQGPHWGCFRHHTYHLPTLVDQQSLSVVSLDGNFISLIFLKSDANSVSEVIRKYQTEKLRNELSFHVLPTFDEKLTKDFDNHALAS